MLFRVSTRRLSRLLVAAAAVFIARIPVHAQLEITEVMYNPVSGDTVWEWFEIRNTAESSVDLDGYFLDDDGDAISEDDGPHIRSVTSGGNAANTLVPAGSVAVLYDGSALDFDDQRFREAWRLRASIPLIAVDSFPSLNNDGESFGLWATKADYDLDVRDTDDDGDLEIGQFNHTAARLTYGTEMDFPADDGAASITWLGVGDYTDGGGWALSQEMVDGGTMSSETFLPGEGQLNDSADIANPGSLPGGSPPVGLLITEIMYDPASEDTDWEWIEIFNRTGAAIDFAETPFVLDDRGGTPLTAANMSSGTIENGEVAILFSDKLTLADMQVAWGSDLNLIPVANWSPLNNGGDTLAIWDKFADAYEPDRPDEPFESAVVTVTYDDGSTWPSRDGQGSIFLSDLGTNAADGANWQISSTDDNLSVHAGGVFTTEPQVDHAGGDVGSPGFFPGATLPTTADFDGDGELGIADIDLLFAELNAGTNNATFDLDDNDVVDDADIAAWLAEVATEKGFAEAIRPGDTDLGGTVDAIDLNNLALNWQADNATSWSQGDFNHDGIVNAQDLNHVGLNWQSDIRNGAIGQAAIPEPSTLRLLVALLLAIPALRFKVRRLPTSHG